MNRRELVIGAVAASLASASDRNDPTGLPAPPLALKHWIHSKPLDIADLRGKVVLLRWWTEGCPMCEATGPALLKLQKAYGERGLQVIGIYHPKPAGDWDVSRMARAATEKHFTFPVALDADWSALKRWWLTQKRDYTSVSFLVDRQGIIRYVHPGGEFHEGNQGSFATHESCQRDFRAIDSEIARLLTS